MIPILIAYADGTTELRDPASPCIADIFEPRLRHPSEERWYLYLPEDACPLTFCGRNVFRLDKWRGGVLVWRLTGGRGEKEPLTGEWQSARVESVDEQIARLTQERDKALALLDKADEAIDACEDARERRTFSAWCTASERVREYRAARSAK